ncbi:hypothetical protein MMPV_009349 [Pyropia vietnamensis]
MGMFRGCFRGDRASRTRVAKTTPPSDKKTPTTTTDVTLAAPSATVGSGTSTMPTIPVKGATRPGVHYHLVSYSRDGSEKAEADGTFRSDALARALSAPDCPYTDVFVSSHGYNTDLVDADDSYQRWMGAMADDTADLAAADVARRAQTGKPFAALLIAVHWPSKLWTAKLASALLSSSDSDSDSEQGGVKPAVATRSLGGAPAATSSAEGASGDAAVERELAQLVSTMNEEDSAALADRPALKAALSTLADAAVHPPVEVAAAAAAVDAGAAAGAAAVQPVLPANLHKAYVELATELAAVDKAAAVGDDDKDDDEPVVTMDPGDAFVEAVKELTAEAATAAAKAAPSAETTAAAAAASTPTAADDTGTTAPVVVSRGLGTFLVGAATTAATAALLRRTAILTLFGRFQHRARVVGRVGVRGLLAKLMAAAATTAGPAPKFHLAGHSLGSHVVSSALVGPRRGGVPLPAKVHSVALVQGAVPAGAYGAGKMYGSMLGHQGPVAGPVVATYSTRDGALWFYGRAYGGEPLGRVGADHQQPVVPRRLVMGGVDATYDLGGGGGHMVNVDASAVVDKIEPGIGGKLVGSHSDVTDPPTTHLIWAAALAGDGSPAEGATR